ncbi:MAG: superoxide dismutase family protein [Myxococcales bacterium]|nr:superoxide dismutase family protein [Myxococcales bacterium]
MRHKLIILGLALTPVLVACDEPKPAEHYGIDEEALATPSASEQAPGVHEFVNTDREANATFASVPKMNLSGEAELEKVASGVQIEIEVEGAPSGKKAVHIHEKSDCSDIAGKSMGGHFAPKGSEHGFPTDPEHHLGDLGNMTVDDDGDGKLEIIVARANLKPGDPMSLVGKAVVIHEAEDDGEGKSGHAGTPIACAPIIAG